MHIRGAGEGLEAIKVFIYKYRCIAVISHRIDISTYIDSCGRGEERGERGGVGVNLL